MLQHRLVLKIERKKEVLRFDRNATQILFGISFTNVLIMARTILDIARKCVKKAGLDAYEPSDVPVRALLLVKIGKNEGERDNIEHAKTTFEKKILSESRINSAKETGRTYIYTESRILCALVDSSAVQIRNIMENLCRVVVGQPGLFCFARVLSVYKIPPSQSKDCFRDYQTKVVTKSAQEQEQKRQEEEKQQILIVEEQAEDSSRNIEEDEASEISSSFEEGEEKEEKEEDQRGIARAACIETCVRLGSDMLKKKSRVGPMNFDFDSLLQSEFIPTLEEYLKLFASKRLILNRDDDFIFPIVS